MSIPNTSPTFPATIQVGKASISTANTDITGATGSLTTLVTGGAQGTRVDRIVGKAVATVVAGLLRFFLHDGVDAYLLDELTVAGTTSSATSASWKGELVRSDGLPVALVPNGWTLKVATTIAQAFHAEAFAGDY